ncbi:uncharacterized protein LOC107767839 [Nicotiana tabacum]|uniref:Uncharacterized protein n=1 Tax=Nicotiana tabacum TaxID=4097 RepID=A0A1S3XR40_TOBAC|nr:PREDICTED: uncharacterized protein LOC107767839 [Nicotiana tabacum]XP_016442423.1 PREDICTED: uncharacterized protein LOC107767839 [Nicotiana tabacum]
MAQRNEGEKNMVKGGRLEEEGHSGLAKCILIMIGLAIFNQHKTSQAHHQRKMAFLEGYKAVKQDFYISLGSVINTWTPTYYCLLRHCNNRVLDESNSQGCLLMGASLNNDAQFLKSLNIRSLVNIDTIVRWMHIF